MLKRRQFLTHSCQLGLSTATLGSSLLQLGMSRQASAQSTDYKALVCILLAGGNDSYNMLVPNDPETYAAYASIRSDLALPQASLLSLSGTDTIGRRYGLHPGMPGLQSLFNSGDAALLQSVGTLLEPMDTQKLLTGSAPLPLGLFSHADQIQQWQTAVSDARIADGWGGRIADILEMGNPANGISMNVSLAGNNVFQSGKLTSPYSISTSGDGAPALNGYNTGGKNDGDFQQVIDSILGETPAHILRREYAQRLGGAIASQEVFSAALANSAPLTANFSDNPFSAALNQITRVINARGNLGASRQTFFITVGGWDHHDDVLDNQAAMLPTIDTGLLEFYNALQTLGLGSQVTTFTVSDFGRTLTSNGQGSDHGWSGHHVVMGGAVNGGAFFGEYPEIYTGNPLDVGRGIYAPTTPVDAYFGELALWFGVSGGDLATILPNAERFYNAQTGSRPLGFMQ